MDIVLEFADRYAFDPLYAWLLPAHSPPYNYPNLRSNASEKAVPTWQYKPASAFLSAPPTEVAYMSSLPRDNVVRQFVSLALITCVFGVILYFLFGTLSYVFIFDKKNKEHPKYLKNQIRLEIKQAIISIPFMSIFTAAMFLGEVRGHSKLYDTTAEGPGMWYNIVQFPFFLIFTDFFIYFIHRGLHHPLVYKRLHKPHHKWIMPTPYASHAFHPIDGFAQSIPYHVFPYLFPLQKLSYLALFVFINIWTIMIHDGEYVANNPIINGAACHSVHHFGFNYNYGQYTTVWDRLGGSYRAPDPQLFNKSSVKKQWNKQAEEMEVTVKEVEGEDDRVYDPLEQKKTR